VLDGVGGDGDCNWLWQVNSHLGAIVPRAAWRVYCDCEPTDHEAAMLACLAGSSAEAPRRLWQRHRERGWLPRPAAFLARLVITPLNHVASFAIPSDAALEAVAAHTPLIECGAGTGYWAALLQQRGVDILPYDVRPPTEAFENGFFDATFTKVLCGGGAELFASHPSLARERTLLLIWPNNPDVLDNPHLTNEPLLQPLWDAPCLAAYLAAGGRTVIYVGERESELRLVDGAEARDCGASSSRRFQRMLSAEFDLERQLELPTWPYNADDLTVWRRHA